MGFFNVFKRNNSTQSTSDNGILGPTFLDGLTEHIQNPEKLHSYEWRRRLRTSSGQTKFKIKFYGQLHEDDENLIVGTDFAPSLVFALDIVTNQEILLFDGCQHGYNALFCDTFSNEQIKNRPAINYFNDKKGNAVFEIIISTYNQIDYDDEFFDQVDEKGFIEIVDGRKAEFEEVKRNGYSALQIFAVNDIGEVIEIVSEELA